MDVLDLAESGILADSEILRAVDCGFIHIDPFTREHLNPTSYDLTLGDEVAVYKSAVVTYDAPKTMHEDGRYFYVNRDGWIDIKREPEMARFKMHSSGWILKPGIGYLMHTRERVQTDCFVPVLDGKSSIGRLFVKVHETAGYGDPGFDGQYTLEVTVQHPIKLYPGMRICQIRFHTIAGRVVKTYDKVGHYTREAARGAVASQAWKQFIPLSPEEEDCGMLKTGLGPSDS